MKKKIALFLILFTFVILVSVFASAEIKHYKNSIQKEYKAGETIKGKINISLTNEPAESVFKSNFPGNITLLSLLKANALEAGKDFECNTINCVPQYTTQSALTELDLDKEKLIGIKIEGDKISQITSFKFNVKSDISAACNTPLTIDIASNDKYIISGTSYNDNPCAVENTGCFSRNLASGYSKIIIEDFDAQEMCETVSVTPAPAYRIGASVINSTIKGELVMILYDSEGNAYDCVLPPHTQNEQDLSCIVNKSSIKSTNFTICIQNTDYCADDSTCPNYKIRSESTSPICGKSNRDFEIFALPLEYKQEAINITSELFEEIYPDSDPLYDQMFNYLIENYGKSGENEIECNPCIIPIKITGNKQKLQFSNIDLKFRNSGFTVDEDSFKKLYELDTLPVKITSGPIQMNIDPAKFTIPLGANESKFSLLLNDILLFKSNISIEKSFDFNINTLFAFLGVQIKFEALTPFNITSSKWDFGDGTPIQEVAGKVTSHKYIESKTYTIKVTLTRQDKVIAIKEFEITAGNPKESANKTIAEYKKRIGRINNKINAYSAEIKNSISTIINVVELNNSLASLEKEYLAASTDEEYGEIMNNLLALDIPQDIISSKKGKLSLIVGFNNIDSDYVEEVSGESAPPETELEKYIIGWYNEHYSSEAQFDTITLFTDNGKEDLLTQFSITISPKPGKEQDAYLFINYPFEGIIFKKDYGQKPLGEDGAAYIPIEAEEQVISFFIKTSIDVQELGAFISPSLSELGIEQNATEICNPEDPKCQVPFKWGKLILWLSIVIVAMLIIYIILQEWYKRHYEHSLFKNRNDLYNLLNFIYNSRVAGLEDSEIRKKLKGTGWSNERITYAFKKIDGKRTGMWEIPLFKSFENKKVREEIEKRQQAPIDARFIKQPRF